MALFPLTFPYIKIIIKVDNKIAKSQAFYTGEKMVAIKKRNSPQKAAKKMDICGGPLAKNILLYTLPLMASGMLQLLFNAADSIVVGRFAENGSAALAAVGATGALINLIINVLMGLAVGASVNVAHCWGAGDKRGVSEVVHTSIFTALVGGILVGAFGYFFSRQFLEMMATPDEIIELATVYMQIYFLGLPAMMVYNFAASILRSTGDTKRPLYFLVIGGVVNVALNLVFIIVLKMSVDGVAIATVISQLISAILCVVHLMRSKGPQKLMLRKLRIHMNRFKKIMLIGIPAGLQGTVFSISNVLIQSSINGFGHVFVTGNSAGSNIEGFIYTAMNSFYHTALTFVGQHIGARKFDRVRSVVKYSLLYVTVAGLFIGYLAFFFKVPLLKIYIPNDPQAVAYGAIRMTVICTTYFLCGAMDTFTGILRGLGSSISPMVISILGVCGFRILWIYTVFAIWPTPTVLFLSYPISWAITIIADYIAYLKIKKKLEAPPVAVMD